MVLKDVRIELRGNVLTIEKKMRGIFGHKRHVELVELTDGAALALRRALNNLEAEHND